MITFASFGLECTYTAQLYTINNTQIIDWQQEVSLFSLFYLTLFTAMSAAIHPKDNLSRVKKIYHEKVSKGGCIISLYVCHSQFN